MLMRFNFLLIIIFINTGLLVPCDRVKLTYSRAEDSRTASSMLTEKGQDKFTYEPNNAFDEDLKTAWVEGVNGPGIGEKVGFSDDPDGYKNIKIFPGYGIKQFWKLNNRVKKLRMIVYEAERIDEEAQQCKVPFRLKKKLGEQILEFTDEFKFQEIPLDHTLFQKSNSKKKFTIFEIMEVYKGTVYDDTPIVEIQFVLDDKK